MSTRWLERSVLVAVGTGGVGKTTTAAAIALEGAARGQRTLVLTIDPARRLAQALGLESLSHEPQRVPLDRIEGVPGTGELSAMMLDTKRTFDELVERFAPDPRARDRILANPIYQQLTDALSGSREYSALEKLSEIHTSRRYDLIVLDTPPAVHALDFLDAPRRLLGFLDGSFLSLLVQPAATLGRGGLRVLRVGSDLALRAFERLTGMAFLKDLSEFFQAFEGMLGGFRERARSVSALLRDPACGFILVAGPDTEQVERALSFWERLQVERVHLVGLIVNRMQPWPRRTLPDTGPASRERASRWLESRLDPQLAGSLIRLACEQAERAQRDARSAVLLEQTIRLEPTQVRRVPMLDEDIHSIEGLRQLRTQLFAERPWSVRRFRPVSRGERSRPA